MTCGHVPATSNDDTKSDSWYYLFNHRNVSRPDWGDARDEPPEDYGRRGNECTTPNDVDWFFTAIFDRFKLLDVLWLLCETGLGQGPAQVKKQS